MEQKRLSANGSSLFGYAYVRLSPPVFSHPIWIRFGKKEVAASLKKVDDLLQSARVLQDVDLSTACQLFLISAVYQNYAGRRGDALKSTRQAFDLAERTGLLKEMTWAIWGASAISVQHGNLQLAANNLVELRAVLHEQNEWMLASFIDVLKASLFQLAAKEENRDLPPNAKPLGDLLALTFEWLQNWGYIYLTSRSENEQKPRSLQSRATRLFDLIRSRFSFENSHSRLQNLFLTVRGELKMTWSENSSAMRNQSSFWASLFSWPRGYLADEHLDSQVAGQLQSHTSSTPKQLRENNFPEIPAANLRSSSTDRKVHEKQPLNPALTTVAVQMLGIFSMIIEGQPQKLPGSRGLSLLKYFLLHHSQKIPREILMDTFWPDAEPNTARNNLNVALYGLRRALRKTNDGCSLILYRNGAYGLASNLQVWLDVEEFERCIQTGISLEARNQIVAATIEYETAISIYQGDFLEDSPYEEWTIVNRERLRIAYLDTLDRLSQIFFSQERYGACITACQLILARDSCREDAHSLLMRCYSRQGQHYLAIRQYHFCVEALRAELEVDPAPETIRLYDHIQRHQPV